MAQKIINARAKNKRDTSANWTAADPVLLDGEIIIVDTSVMVQRSIPSFRSRMKN